MEIRDFTDLYQRITGLELPISSFISGHLVIEFLLRKLIQVYDPNLSNLADKLNHSKLIELSHDLGIISDEQRHTLATINKIRNKFAHDITYEPNISELKSLFRLAATAFSDLTDGIGQGLGELESSQEVSDLEEWVVPELFIQISYDLHELYQMRGGDEEVF
ncbi:MAG: hypothetical protein ACTS2F_31315 [Thainema sp.]